MKKVLYYLIWVVIFVGVDFLLCGLWVLLFTGKPGSLFMFAICFLAYLATSFIAPYIKKLLNIE